MPLGNVGVPGVLFVAGDRYIWIIREGSEPPEDEGSDDGYASEDHQSAAWLDPPTDPLLVTRGWRLDGGRLGLPVDQRRVQKT